MALIVDSKIYCLKQLDQSKKEMGFGFEHDSNRSKYEVSHNCYGLSIWNINKEDTH